MRQRTANRRIRKLLEAAEDPLYALDIMDITGVSSGRTYVALDALDAMSWTGVSGRSRYALRSGAEALPSVNSMWSCGAHALGLGDHCTPMSPHHRPDCGPIEAVR